MAPGPIAARTGGRIDGAMPSSDESFWGWLDKTSFASRRQWRTPVLRYGVSYIPPNAGAAFATGLALLDVSCATGSIFIDLKMTGDSYRLREAERARNAHRAS